MSGKRDIIVGEQCVALYKGLESVEFEIKDMFDKTVIESLSKVAQSMSCPTIYLSHSLIGVVSSCMGAATVNCTKTHSEPAVIWSAILGMKGTAKSPAFEYTTGPIMFMESREMRDAKNAAKAKEKENKKDDKEEDESNFKKELYQKILVNGTLQGLEDVLAAKYDKGVTPGVLFACDELSVLFSNLEKDATFDSTFLMLYTAKFLRTNTRSYGLLDIVNPRVNITGYTQPETILKFMVKSEEDSGGKWERFIFAAPPKMLKQMGLEAEVDMDNVVSIDKVLEIVTEFHKTPREFEFTPDAKKRVYELIDERGRDLYENARYDSHASGLQGKATSKIIRLSAVVQTMEKAYNAAYTAHEEDVRPVDPEQIMFESLQISVDSVDRAFAIVAYSDKIATLLHQYTHKMPKERKSLEVFCSDINDVSMTDQKLMSFSNHVVSIYTKLPVINGNQVLVNDIQRLNFFPQSTPEVRKKYLKSNRCLYFLRCLESKGLVKVSENLTTVDLLLVDEEKPEHVVALIDGLKKKNPEFALCGESASNSGVKRKNDDSEKLVKVVKVDD